MIIIIYSSDKTYIEILWSKHKVQLYPSKKKT